MELRLEIGKRYLIKEHSWSSLAYDRKVVELSPSGEWVKLGTNGNEFWKLIRELVIVEGLGEVNSVERKD